MQIIVAEQRQVSIAGMRVGRLESRPNPRTGMSTLRELLSKPFRRSGAAAPPCRNGMGGNKKAPDGSGTRMKTNLLIYGDGTTILPCGNRPNRLKASVVNSGETRPNSRVKSCQIDISAHAGFSRPTQKGQQMGTFRLPGSPAYENNQAAKGCSFKTASRARLKK